MTNRIAALPLLLLLAAACGGDATPQAAPASATPATVAEATPTATSTAKPAPLVETVYFTSPSGRIGCSLASAGAVCEVSGHRWAMPRKPADCDLDWGGMVELRPTGTAEHVCHSDTVFGAGPLPVLAYGASRTAGPFRCTSARAGVTCVHTGNGHGFTVSRDAARLY